MFIWDLLYKRRFKNKKKIKKEIKKDYTHKYENKYENKYETLCKNKQFENKKKKITITIKL